MAPVPKTMKGVRISQTGGSEVLEYRTDLPVPTLKEGQVLVKNEYIGINYIDTYFRTGLYPSPMPLVLGREASGTIVEMGPGNQAGGLTVNDRVVWLGTESYAEFSAAPSEKVLKIPEGIKSEDACAAVLQGLTALTLVTEAHAVQRGDWVLVLAASGGVGGWLTQILKAKGAHTIGTVSRQEKVAIAKEQGAEVVLIEGEDDVVKIVKEKTGGAGVVAVFDSVGKVIFDRSLQCVARKGTMVSYGNASGAVEPFPISRLSATNAKVLRPTLFNYIYTREETERYADELWRMMIEDKFTVRIHEIYPLKDVARAHNDIESRKTMGKLLMTP